MVQKIKVPVKLVASLGWGGCDHKTLYVTSSQPFFNITNGAVSNSFDQSTRHDGMTYAITDTNFPGGVTAHSFYV